MDYHADRRRHHGSRRFSGLRSVLRNQAERPARFLALLVADQAASAAALFTTNQAQAAPLLVCREHLAISGGLARLIVTNSGCANACTVRQGLEDAREMAELAAEGVGVAPSQALVASTGVIGVNLNMTAVRRGVNEALDSLSPEGHAEAAEAIMTTDPFPKASAVEVETAQGRFRVGGMAKGSGMIEPRMATMLGYLTTDAEVEPGTLWRALDEASRDTFNAITVDGESSTNDCVFALASGSSPVRIDESLYPALVAGLRAVALDLSLAIVRGGEGATKLVSITVSGAASEDEARTAARVIANSLLVKTAIHGGDPNWGRLVAAAGRSGVTFALDSDDRSHWNARPLHDGQPHDHLAPEAAGYLMGKEIEIEVNVGAGGDGHRATIYTCDRPLNT